MTDANHQLSWLLVPIALVASACGDDRSADATTRTDGRKNVVLICMDTVRADHVGFGGYTARDTTPNLDALAARSLVFDDASAVSGWTKPSVPSYLTGTPPAVHGVYEGSARGLDGVTTDILPADATTLAEVFQGEGYRTGAFIQNAQLRLGNGFEQGFDDFQDGAGDAREIRWKGLDWLDDDPTAGEEPFFLYLHFLDAHWPYPAPDEYATLWAAPEDIEPYRSGSSRALRDAINDGDVTFGTDEREALVALYDGSIRYLDAELGRLFHGLEQRGLAGDTIIAVVSDHGEEFGEHGRIGHGHGLYENLLQVPFLLHVPGEPGRRHAEPVTLLDLFPTLLSAAELEVPGTHVGVDRFSGDGEPAFLFAEHKAPDRYLHSLREGDAKLVRTFTPPAKPRASHPLRADRRYEAELEVGADGALVATQLKLRDEDVDDPPELKGPIAGLADAAEGERTFTLGGLPVTLPLTAAVTYTDGAEGAALADGRMVKVRGTVTPEGLVAERIKVYADDAERVLELRGPLEGLELAGEEVDAPLERVRLAGQWVRVTAETNFKGMSGKGSKPRMTRDEVAEVLRAGSAAAEAGFDLELTWWRRSAEGELPDPAVPDERSAAAGAELDALLEFLVRRQVFSGDDSATLTEEQLADLAAIGYTD